VDVVKYKDLPFRDVLFLTDDSLVAVGHDCTPVLFSQKGGWQFVKKIDEGGSAADSKAQSNAFKVFQTKVDKGQESVQETTLTTKHQNCIT
jgi:actin related protein 2/3 complex subunit 1A/1B